MKANNLTISVYTPRCKNECPFCISKMTGDIPYNKDLYWRNLDKVKTITLFGGISSVLITSKGEPLDNLDDTLRIISYFDSLHFPVELQTNGKFLVKNQKVLSTLYKKGLNVLAVSIAHPSDLIRNETMLIKANEEGLVTRLTIVLSHDWKSETFYRILAYCTDHNVSQLTFRIPTIPQRYVDTKESMLVRQWVSAQEPRYYKQILEAMKMYCSDDTLTRKLPFGAAIHDIKGVGVTVMDYCIQEVSNGDDLRSLVYQTDGHLYTTWDKKGSILF
jgi:molybdenum cofactor biosynthesis enzyme MoaA